MPRKYTRKNNRRRVKRGGDIESGIVEDIKPMTAVPPDPERFKKFDEQIIQESMKPVSEEKVASVFSDPTPEKKQVIEQQMMSDEDPLNKNPFDVEELSIFSEKGGSRRSRRSNRRNRRRS